VATCAGCGKELSGEFVFCPFCGTPVAAPKSREARKVVTVLFCDVTGSTELGERLDPEALRVVLARYFERMKAIVEQHGGSVEKFIGDAVMAVFGVPVVHEDDALRALRAAVAMRDALPELGVEGRIGVMTGEVVTGTDERLATGDAVNVAARLEQGAQPGEILIGAETLRLTRAAAEVEAVAPLAAKGKSEPLEVYRLVAVHGDEGLARRLDTPLVGRRKELRRLHDALDLAVADRSCQLFTILGAAGVGKSRLAAEFLGAYGDVRIVRGRCLPYGEGITYWPVVEIVEQLPEVPLDAASQRGIRTLLGEEDVAAKEEIARAVRRLLEGVAADAPLICVFDDVHWGEQTFLDLVEHIADVSREVPILLLCIARPELLEVRPGWGGGKVNSTTVLLEPLGAEDARAMISSLADLDEDACERILNAAEGNPLFVEQMVALVGDSADGDVAVPPTIQALLAARLEQLDEPERVVLERGAVEGRIFHQSAVEALAPDEPHVATRLTSLVRKELVRPDKPQFAGEDAFRFRHVLIRDAAYDALPKSTRAELHQRFAAWLNGHGSHLVELEELLGYHLEQAYRCRIDLGLADGATAELGREAARWLGSAGRRACDRNDMPAAVNLLERAASLLPPDDPARLRLLPVLGTALMDNGQWERAGTVLAEAIERAEAGRDRGTAAEATVELCFLRLHTDPGITQAEIETQLVAVTSELREVGDERRLARALTLAGRLPFWRGECEHAVAVCEEALEYARRADDTLQEVDALASLVTALVEGPGHIQVAFERAQGLGALTTGSSRADVHLLRCRAELEALRGNLEHARELAAEAGHLAEELGLTILLATGVARVAARIELLAGDAPAAERAARKGCDVLEQAGDWGHLGSLLPYLADALFEQGRAGEEAAKVELASERVIEDDMDARIGLARAKTKILAERGDLEQAERAARDGVALAEQTDYLLVSGLALETLATVLRLRGRDEEAARVLERAVAGYERKGCAALVTRAQGILESAS
jgi:class 3 adenylate cyclase/tetratricopeptide (TPR) repeat protein